MVGSQDEEAQCTLVAIACRDHGFHMLPTWVKPFQNVFEGNDRVEIVHLHLVEGWFGSKILKPIIRRQVKTNTPPQEHDHTLICFRKELEEWRDILRLHNPLAGYVFLLDGLARIRFAGSGEASPEEVEKLIQFAHDITPHIQHSKSNKSNKISSSNRRGSRRQKGTSRK